MENTTMYQFGVSPRTAAVAVRSLVRIVTKYPGMARRLTSIGPRVRFRGIDGGTVTIDRDAGVASIIEVDSNVHPLPHIDGVAAVLAAIAVSQ